MPDYSVLRFTITICNTSGSRDAASGHIPHHKPDFLLQKTVIKQK